MGFKQTLFLFLGILLILGATPDVSFADTKPCRGFVGAPHSRGELLALCGQPDEILEQETKRLILWRYRGYSHVVVRASSVDSRLSGRGAAQPPLQIETDQVEVGQELFRKILDEAAAQSTEPTAAQSQ